MSEPVSSERPAGRYAPSPTGVLHLGSLAAALASYLHARSRGADWYMRMEDLDPTRAVDGAADDILWTLEAFGLTWDGPVLYQSTRADAYMEALERLRDDGAVFDCGCTRREARTGPMGEEGPIYPGICRDGLPAGRSARSVRLRTEERELAFRDGVQGLVEQDLARDVGDFIVRRADGRAAYQLAVVVDDAFQDVTEVVRGADLLPSTPRQILLQSLLGLPQPAYWHIPLLLDRCGRKLGKSSGAPELDAERPAPVLARALQVLGQRPPADLVDSGRDAVLDWGIRHWRVDRVPGERTVTPGSRARLDNHIVRTA